MTGRRRAAKRSVLSALQCPLASKNRCLILSKTRKTRLFCGFLVEQRLRRGGYYPPARRRAEPADSSLPPGGRCRADARRREYRVGERNKRKNIFLCAYSLIGICLSVRTDLRNEARIEFIYQPVISTRYSLSQPNSCQLPPGGSPNNLPEGAQITSRREPKNLPEGA